MVGGVEDLFVVVVMVVAIWVSLERKWHGIYEIYLLLPRRRQRGRQTPVSTGWRNYTRLVRFVAFMNTDSNVQLVIS